MSIANNIKIIVRNSSLYDVVIDKEYSDYLIKKKIINWMTPLPIKKIRRLYGKPHIEVELKTGKKILFVIYEQLKGGEIK